MSLKTKVYAFVGPSGTGKSYRAQLVASEHNIHYIIDDGLLIHDNDVNEENKEKKAPTKVETVKKAIFIDKEDKKNMVEALKKLKPESILILGTSDGMVEKIAENLGLEKPEKTIYINEVATETEMETAKRIRTTEGKHVIPVPTFEIKRDFAGYILDPLQIFKYRRNNEPYISEKSIIRPTFSYLGKFTISDTVFRQITEYVAKKTEGIHRVSKVRVENSVGATNIYVEVYVVFGYNIVNVLREFKQKVKKEIERLTTMNVQEVSVLAKGIHIPENKIK